ncbi:DEAD/DEAH box helicase family protein [Amycolatopsis sp. NPDC004747]
MPAFTVQPITLRDYQRDAVERIVDGLGEGGRGQLRMACATGKTFVTVAAAQRLIAAGAVVVVLCPTLDLLGQTLRVWSRHLAVTAIAVCSDDDVAAAYSSPR